MADWEDDDFEPEVAIPGGASGDKWEGEDEDDGVKDNWDDEDETKERTNTAVQVPKKKSLKERIAEREAKKKEELLEKKKMEEEEFKKLTPEEQMTEKLRRQKMQEESDLKVACETFGVPDSGSKVDGFIPVTKEDFETFENMLKDKVTQFEKSPYYVGFLENLYRDLAVSLEPEDVKRLGSALNTLGNEKTKAQKGTKSKKKKGPKLMAGKDAHIDIDAFDDGTYGGEFDDFM